MQEIHARLMRTAQGTTNAQELTKRACNGVGVSQREKSRKGVSQIMTVKITLSVMRKNALSDGPNQRARRYLIQDYVEAALAQVRGSAQIFKRPLQRPVTLIKTMGDANLC